MKLNKNWMKIPLVHKNCAQTFQENLSQHPLNRERENDWNVNETIFLIMTVK